MAGLVDTFLSTTDDEWSVERGEGYEEDDLGLILKKKRKKKNKEPKNQPSYQNDSRGRGSPQPSNVSGNQAAASPANRVRLVFPPGCGLSFSEKLVWTVKLARSHRRFEPILKEGTYRPYVTVGSQEAVEVLTTTGYEGVVLQKPDNEHFTKVLIHRYPMELDAEFLLDDPRFVWAKTHIFRGKQKNQVVALMKGKEEEIPSKVFIAGAGYRPLTVYWEEPLFCLRCSRWGHKSWRCQLDPRCRFCARKHLSSECGNKIKNGTTVDRRCCNCGDDHNATFWRCPKRPAFPQPQTGQQERDMRGEAGSGSHARPTQRQASLGVSGGARQAGGQEEVTQASVGRGDSVMEGEDEGEVWPPLRPHGFPFHHVRSKVGSHNTAPRPPPPTPAWARSPAPNPAPSITPPPPPPVPHSGLPSAAQRHGIPPLPEPHPRPTTSPAKNDDARFDLLFKAVDTLAGKVDSLQNTLNEFMRRSSFSCTARNEYSESEVRDVMESGCDVMHTDVREEAELVAENENEVMMADAVGKVMKVSENENEVRMVDVGKVMKVDVGKVMKISENNECDAESDAHRNLSGDDRVRSGEVKRCDVRKSVQCPKGRTSEVQVVAESEDDMCRNDQGKLCGEYSESDELDDGNGRSVDRDEKADGVSASQGEEDESFGMLDCMVNINGKLEPMKHGKLMGIRYDVIRKKLDNCQDSDMKATIYERWVALEKQWDSYFNMVASMSNEPD